MSLKQHVLCISMRRALIGACALSFSAIAPIAVAQEAQEASPPQTQPSPQAQAPAQAKEAVTLDRMIVTAQSREQELQDVPIALQVVNEQLLGDVGAENLGDIEGFVPGLQVNSNQPTQPSFQLRGIQTDDFGIGTDSAVGVYIDGVYAGRGGGVLLPFTDVERIEILKGPQGTLFGRNTAAGAISIITNKPSDEQEARAKLRLGNDHKQYLEAMVNLPTGEDSALRLNGLFNHSKGWIKDAATGEDLNPENNWATRAAWRMRFGDNTSAVLSWDHESLSQRAQATTGIVALPPEPGVPPVPVDETAYLDPRKTPTYNDAIGSDESRRFDGVTLIVDHSMDWGSMTSTTAWRDYDSNNTAVDEDGTNRRNLYIDSTNTESSRSYYQEIKFNGSNEHVDWVAGASYYDEKSQQTSEVNLFSDSVDTAMVSSGLIPPEFVQPNGPLPPGVGLFTFGQGLLDAFNIPIKLLGQPWNEAYHNRLKSKSYALFGDVIWHVNDKLNLTFGLRYTRDKKEFSWFNPDRTAPGLDASLDQLEQMGLLAALGLNRDDLLFNVAFSDPVSELYRNQTVRTKHAWSDFSPRFVVDYHLNDDTMVFASLAKGYKAGGYNALQINSRFDNEEVWNFETGIKQAFPDLRLQYNASLFYYVYDNRQSTVLDFSTDIPRFVVDTADIEAYGLDFDTVWKPTDALSLDFNVEYIDSTYKEYKVGNDDLSGQPSGEPRWSFAAGVNYLWNLNEAGDVRFTLRHAYRGKARCNDQSQEQGACGPSRALDLGEAENRTDVRVAWTSPRGHWTWAVFGNNVFDNQYINSLGTYGKTVLGTVGARVTAPRMYGVEAQLKF
ncbi:TonB-dependent receptor [Luteimonas panaciterrae]|uniref:TonB-dependent receptor n=1 Tax=Luteimonas panaciterrae TaxID=363885 RepID=UPI001CFBFF5C|nr:TonB-dependent receptor [Luteimonas panaciterrae]